MSISLYTPEHTKYLWRSRRGDGVDKKTDCGNVLVGGRERLLKCVSSSFSCSACGFLISSESSSSSSSLAGPYPVSSSPIPVFPSSVTTCLKCWEQKDLPWTETTKETGGEGQLKGTGGEGQLKVTGGEGQLKALVNYYLLTCTPQPLSCLSFFLPPADTEVLKPYPANVENMVRS